MWYVGLEFDNQILSLKNIKIDTMLPKLFPAQKYKTIILDNS